MSRIFCFALVLCAGAGPADKKAPAEPYRAYWLWRDDPKDRSEYLPLLLVTRGPLDKLSGLEQKDQIEEFRKNANKIPFDANTLEIVKQKEREFLLDAKAITAETYKKDSIWNLDGRPFK